MLPGTPAAFVLALAFAAPTPAPGALAQGDPQVPPDESVTRPKKDEPKTPPATEPSEAQAVECSGATDLGKVVYTLDHRSGSPPPAPVTLKDGERFTVKVTRTYPTLFTYRLYRQRAAPEKRAILEDAELADVCLTEVHDKQFGGYTLVVQERTPVADYPPVVVVNIPVQTPQWTYGFAGAFVGNRLVDHVYYASKEKQADGSDADVVREIPSNERDWAKLGTAAFIHTSPPSWPVAFSFGLGIADGNKPTYYVGPSLRLGEQAFVTGGLAVGAVNRLPAGLRVGDRLSDPNALTTLRPRNTAGVFIALSYAFLNGRKAVEKPFAPTDGAAASTTPNTDVKATPATDGKR